MAACRGWVKSRQYAIGQKWPFGFASHCGPSRSPTRVAKTRRSCSRQSGWRLLVENLKNVALTKSKTWPGGVVWFCPRATLRRARKRPTHICSACSYQRISTTFPDPSALAAETRSKPAAWTESSLPFRPIEHSLSYGSTIRSLLPFESAPHRSSCVHRLPPRDRAASSRSSGGRRQAR